MEKLEPKQILEAMKNVRDFNFTRLPKKEIFDVMRESLMKAFDKVTTFDMRVLAQVGLIEEGCGIKVVQEKDNKFYQAIVLSLKINDWNPEIEYVDFLKKDYFQLVLTPFTCLLTRVGDKDNMYADCDKELTEVWRKFLKQKFPLWETAFNDYNLNLHCNGLGI